MRERTLAPVAERFSQVSPDNFGDTIDQLWQAAEKLIEPVKDAVHETTISPVQGLGIVSCITGQLFGYNEFHGDVKPADLVGLLTEQTTRYASN